MSTKMKPQPDKTMKRFYQEFGVNPGDSSQLIAESFGVTDGWVNKIVDVELPAPLPQVVLIVGDSGCGKSTLLRAIEESPVKPLPPTPLHLWSVSEEEALKLLNSVGLNDASLFVLKFSQLSDSQQARARMFWALCCGLRTVVVDEFLSTLDRRTAQALAFSFQKVIRRSGRQLVVATAHEDLIPFLQPDLVIRGKAFPSRWTVETPQVFRGNPFLIEVVEETKEAYRESRLGELHYKGKYSGGRQRYFCARISGEVVGWLVGKLLPGTRQHRISRVVVHPTYRGVGVGQALICRYLEEQPDCDVVAGMARFNPVFLRAGMKQVADLVVPIPPSLRGIGLSSLEWASKTKCVEFMTNPQNRELVVPFSSSQFVNPGGSMAGSEDRKSRVVALVRQSAVAAGAVLWGIRPRTLAKFVGPTHKEFDSQ